MVYSTDRSKAVVPVLVLFFYCFVVYSTRRLVLSLVLCFFFLCFSVLLALRLPRLGERELILVLFFTMSLSEEKQSEVIEASSSTSRYLEDILNIDNNYFEGLIGRTYP